MYQIIMADPPWKYIFSKSKKRRVEEVHPTTTLSELCEVSLPSDPKGCVLFLWVPAPKLEDGLALMRAWGFKYITGAIWYKHDMKRGGGYKRGMGYWFRVNHEHLLVGRRGTRIKAPDKHARVDSVFELVRKPLKKMEKPKRLHILIHNWWPQAKKLELFARRAAPGWDLFGDELPIRGDILDERWTDRIMHFVEEREDAWLR